MARVPGGPGKQLFGIGRFVPAGFMPDGFFQTPATANGGNVARLERVVYDQTSTPVFVPAPQSEPQSLVGAVTDIVCRTAIGSLAVFASTSAAAEPVFVPAVAPATISSTLASTHSSATAIASRVVYDQTSTPVFVPPAAVVTPVGYQAVDAVWLRQRKALPDGVAVPPTRLVVTVTPVEPSDLVGRKRRINLPEGVAVPPTRLVTITPVASSDLIIRKRRTNLPDGYAAPVTVPAATAISYGALGTSCTVIRTSVIIGAQTSTPVFPPEAVGALTSTLPLGTSCTIVRTSVIVQAQTSTPVFPPTAAAPVAGRFVPSDTTVWKRQSKIKPVPLSAFVLAYPIADTLPLGTSLTVVRTSIVIGAQTSTPVFPPAAAAPVAGRFVPSDTTAWTRRQKIKRIPLSAFVLAYPIDNYLAQDYTGQFIRSKRNKILPDGIAIPPFIPPPPITSKLVGGYGAVIVIRSRVVYDQTSAPVFRPLAVTPPAFGHQRIDAVLRRQQRKILPDGVVQQLRITTATPPDFGVNQTVDAVWRKQKKVLPEGLVKPPFQVLAVTPSEYQTVDSVLRRQQRKVLPEGYTAPVTSRASIVGAPAGFGYQTVDAVWRKQKKVLPEGLVKPPFKTLTVTPAAFGYQTVDAVWRKFRKVRADDGFVRPLILPPPSPVVPPGAVTGGGGLGFSYQRYERLVNELYQKKKKAPPKAKKALAKAIAVVKQIDTSAEDLARLLQALEAAAAISTQNTLALINAANAAAEQARLILEQQRLQRLREEDDLILLMLDEED